MEIYTKEALQKHESETLSQEDMQQMQDYQAQRDYARDLRKSAS
jgi:hypothetical protein